MNKTVLFCMFAVLLFAGFITAGDKSGEKIDWQVISSGGGMGGSSTNYTLSGTVSQTATGEGSSTSYGVTHGFWQDFSIQSGCASPGDADNSGGINLLDITRLINYLYKSGPAPVPYAVASGDPNCDCNVNLLDITFLINFLYKSGAAPCDCATWLSNC